jgi:hypothetical protein
MSMDYKDNIITWAQGIFIDKKEYKNWTQQEKEAAEEYEKHLVRPRLTENYICYCEDPNDAIWISNRLNLLAWIELYKNIHEILEDLR